MFRRSSVPDTIGGDLITGHTDIFTVLGFNHAACSAFTTLALGTVVDGGITFIDFAFPFLIFLRKAVFWFCFDLVGFFLGGLLVLLSLAHARIVWDNPLGRGVKDVIPVFLGGDHIGRMRLVTVFLHDISIELFALSIEIGRGNRTSMRLDGLISLASI